MQKVEAICGEAFATMPVPGSLDAVLASSFALGFKNAHGDSPPGLPHGLVVTCLVPKERWVLLQPMVVHSQGIGSSSGANSWRGNGGLAAEGGRSGPPHMGGFTHRRRLASDPKDEKEADHFCKVADCMRCLRLVIVFFLFLLHTGSNNKRKLQTCYGYSCFIDQLFVLEGIQQEQLWWDEELERQALFRRLSGHSRCQLTYFAELSEESDFAAQQTRE